MEGRQEHFNAPLGIILDLRKRHKDSRAGFCAPPPPPTSPTDVFRREVCLSQPRH